MRLVISGGRNFNNYDLLKKSTHKLFYKLTTETGYIKNWKDDVEIVWGTALGADTLAKKFADEYKLKHKPFPAKWDDINTPGAIVKYNKYGKSYNAKAGYDRNLQMALYAKEDSGVLLAFHDGKSRGTGNMIQIAKKHDLKIFIIKY